MKAFLSVVTASHQTSSYGLEPGVVFDAEADVEVELVVDVDVVIKERDGLADGGEEESHRQGQHGHSSPPQETLQYGISKKRPDHFYLYCYF